MFLYNSSNLMPTLNIINYFPITSDINCLSNFFNIAYQIYYHFTIHYEHTLLTSFIKPPPRCLSTTDWSDEVKVSRPEILRLIYQGRFLHGSVTLNGKLICFLFHLHLALFNLRIRIRAN